MSECVVRMETPNGCHDCKLRNMVGNCPIPMFDGQDEEKVWTLEECFQRPPWCPILCQLPEGHGRLGDLDELKNWLVSQMEHYNRFDYGAICSTMVSAYETVCKVIDSMTAIVSAEAKRSEI